MSIVRAIAVGLRMLSLCARTSMRTVRCSYRRGGEQTMATTQNPTNQEIVKKLQQILQELSDLRGEIAGLSKTA